MRKHICILLGSGWFLKTSNLRSRLTQKLLRVSKNSEVPMEIKNKQTKTAQKGCCHIPSPLKDSIYRPWKLTVIIFIKHEEKILAFLPAHFFLACVWTWCLEVEQAFYDNHTWGKGQKFCRNVRSDITELQDHISSHLPLDFLLCGKINPYQLKPLFGFPEPTSESIPSRHGNRKIHTTKYTQEYTFKKMWKIYF